MKAALHAPYAGMIQIRWVGYFSAHLATDTPGEVAIVMMQFWLHGRGACSQRGSWFSL